MSVSRLVDPAASTGLYTPDLPQSFIDAFGPASAYDCEFNRSTSPITLPTNWVWQNQNSATYLEQLGSGQESIASGFNTVQSITCLVQPISAAASWTATGKAYCQYEVANFGMSPGLVLTDGTKAAGIFWNDNPLVLAALWTNLNVFNSNPGTTTVTVAQSRVPYWRIRKNSATNYDFQFSYDCMTWLTTLSGYDLSAYMTPTHFGFLFRQSSGVQLCTFDWFRVR